VTKGEETRARIVDRAMELASTMGIEGITLGSLAESLELSKSGLFAHFKSREALQIAVLQNAAEHFREIVVAPALRAPRGEPRIRALFERWIAWGKSKTLPGGCVFVSAAVELDDRPGPVRDILVQTQKDWIDLLSQTARTAVEEGQFHRDLDVDQFAFELYGIVLGFHHQSRLFRDPKALSRMQTAFERLLASARRGAR
jgi:AcrR family transcriptional regulator